jgi:hypothetical protein
VVTTVVQRFVPYGPAFADLDMREALARAIEWCVEDTPATIVRAHIASSPEFAPRCRFIAQRFGASNDEADELASHCFIAYMEQGPDQGLRQPVSLDVALAVTGAWTKTTIARNFWKMRRLARREPLGFGESDEGHGPPPTDPLRDEESVEDVVDRRDLTRYLLAALNDAAEQEHRILLDFIDWPEDSAADRSRRLGMTPNNVYQVIHRLRKRVRRLASAHPTRLAAFGAAANDDGPHDEPGGGPSTGRKRKTMTEAKSTRVEAAAAQLTRARDDLNGGGGEEAATRLATAAGVLDLMGRGVTARELLHGLDEDDRAFVARSARAVDGESLDRALGVLADCAAELSVPQAVPDPEAGVRALAALDVRHEVEALLVGAALIAGAPVEPGGDLASSIEAFDEVVGENLWQLTPLSSGRRERRDSLASEARERCWWWTRGADVSEIAAESLAAVASLRAAFPESTGAIDDQAAYARSGGTPAPAGTLPGVLIDFILTSQPTGRDDAAGLRLTADEEERVVYQTDEVVLSVHDFTLIVDYESGCEPDPEAPPRMDPDVGLHVPGRATLPGRFELSLREVDPRAATAVLRIPRRGAEPLCIPVPWETP